MKKWNFILGVDVSKKTLDVYCSQVNEHIKIANSSEGFKMLRKWSKLLKIDLSQAIIVMEFTGGYEYKLIQFCESLSVAYTRIPGLAIKNSLGISRGKNDQVDSKRIALYAEEKIKSITPSKPLNYDILHMKEMLSHRKKLVRINAGFKASLKERLCMKEVKGKDIIAVSLQKMIKATISQIKVIEEAMKTFIQSNDAMLRSFQILTSIKGIGAINAMMTIAYTENFTSFDNPRRYAVYVGVVPFDHSSGTSLKGRKRVSHLANKELKQELNQAAKTAILWDKELKDYATRKIQSKHYRLVLNNVKFKLILRMFSLIKRGEMYVENYKNVA